MDDYFPLSFVTSGIMQEFIEYLVKNLVEHPDKVMVECTQGSSDILVQIRVADNDVGKVVGKQGKTINALRTITSSIGTRLGCRLKLDLIQ